MQVILDHTEDLSDHIRSFWFAPAKSVDYGAGQFIEMHLPHDGADERGQKHWFTLSSSPSEQLLSITTRHATGRSSTFKQTLFGLANGSRVQLSEPMGDFVLPKDQRIPLLFVAGGIGVTPVRSIIKWLTDTHEQRDVQILYGARTVDDLVFRELLEAYGAKVSLVLSQPTADWSGLIGQLTGEAIMELAEPHPDQLIYISGPEPMTESLEGELLTHGVASEKLVLDFFPGYTQP